MRVARLLADRGGGLEADEEEDPEEHPAEDAPPVRSRSPVSPGSKTLSEIPSAPPFATITIARISIGTNETAANVSIAPTAMRTPM